MTTLSTDAPISSLRERMQNDMLMRGLRSYSLCEGTRHLCSVVVVFAGDKRRSEHPEVAFEHLALPKNTTKNLRNNSIIPYTYSGVDLSWSAQKCYSSLYARWPSFRHHPDFDGGVCEWLKITWSEASGRG